MSGKFENLDETVSNIGLADYFDIPTKNNF